MIWVYAVCERPELPLPGVCGLAGAPLETVADGPLVAVLSRHARAPDAPVREALWAHERVVEALMADRAVLPVRFGTRSPCADDLRATLAGRRAVLLDGLGRVRGRVELAVRAKQRAGPPTAGPAPADGSGRAYLDARLAEARAVAALHEPLAALAVATADWPRRAPGELLRASYLVAEPAVGRFRGAVQRLQREHPQAVLLCTGPWPAYSFVPGASG